MRARWHIGHWCIEHPASMAAAVVRLRRLEAVAHIQVLMEPCPKAP